MTPRSTYCERRVLGIKTRTVLHRSRLLFGSIYHLLCPLYAEISLCVTVHVEHPLTYDVKTADGGYQYMTARRAFLRHTS